MAQTATFAGIARTRETGIPTITLFVRDDFAAQLETDMDQVFIQAAGVDFAENGEMQYTHRTGEERNYPVIFDNSHASANVRTSAEFSSIRPQVQIQETKLARPIQHDDKAVIRGITYKVEDFVSDGVGVTTIFLRLK